MKELTEQFIDEYIISERRSEIRKLRNILADSALEPGFNNRLIDHINILDELEVKVLLYGYMCHRDIKLKTDQI